jgi:hypothetical protein
MSDWITGRNGPSKIEGSEPVGRRFGGARVVVRTVTDSKARPRLTLKAVAGNVPFPFASSSRSHTWLTPMDGRAAPGSSPSAP